MGRRWSVFVFGPSHRDATDRHPGTGLTAQLGTELDWAAARPATRAIEKMADFMLNSLIVSGGKEDELNGTWRSAQLGSLRAWGCPSI